MVNEGFRANEIEFLQQHNNEILAELERVDALKEEHQGRIEACKERDSGLQQTLQEIRDKISALGERVDQNRHEQLSKDQHVLVLKDQNTQMLQMLEEEERRTTDTTKAISKLQTRNRKLQQIAEAFDVEKAAIEKNVASAREKCAERQASVKSQRSHNEKLRANIQNMEAKTMVEREALAQALQVVDQRNLEYMQRINKQETKEQQLQSEKATLEEEAERLRAEIDQLRKQLEGDDESRTTFERARGQFETIIEDLEVKADSHRKALSAAERANEQLQEENRASKDRCRDTMDKVYALTDSLRLNQVELKKQQAENGARDKKLHSLEQQCQNLTAKIAMETDARVLAEQERREAEQESTVLRKKNKKVEDAVTSSQVAQERAEKEISEVNQRLSQLQTHNAYVASRVDSQEEEKNTIKTDIKNTNDRTTTLTKENTQYRAEIDTLRENIATCTGDKEQYQKELEYIKREDVLDEAGRQRPVLIQSNESDLLEKLQVNEFLYEAQQARNPVPPLVEKIAQLLAMLHDGQTHADQYLADLSKSNGLVSANRQRNMALFARTQMFESFKTRALTRYVMNMVEADLASELFLDGLSFGMREIKETINLLQQYDATEKVYIISLVENGLDDECVNLLLQLVYMLPYLRKVDLRGNSLTNTGMKKLEEQLKTMEGITGVVKSANNVINAHSGNQLRLSIDASDQVLKESLARAVDFDVQHELGHQDADPFLASDTGTSKNPWAQMHQDQQKSKQIAMPDPSATELAKVTSAPPAPAIGGPPVGLGGPGNVSSLNKKQDKNKNLGSRPSDPKRRQSRSRAKGAPPPALSDPEPPHVYASEGRQYQCPPQPHRLARSSSVSRRRETNFLEQGVMFDDRSSRSSSLERSMDKSTSLPTLRRVASRPSYAGARV